MINALIMAASIACLTEAMYYEARGEGYHGMVAVGAVIYNRALSPHFSDDICSVIEKPNQFSYLPTGVEAGTLPLPNEEVAEKARQAAIAVLSSAEDGATPLLDNVLYFHNQTVTPNWNYDLLEEYGTVGNHTFYIDNE